MWYPEMGQRPFKDVKDRKATISDFERIPISRSTGTWQISGQMGPAKPNVMDEVAHMELLAGSRLR
jgi:hypothetical protein